MDHLSGAQKRIQLRQTALFYKADPDYGCRVTEGLNLEIKDVERLAGMHKEERARATGKISADFEKCRFVKVSGFCCRF